MSRIVCSLAARENHFDFLNSALGKLLLPDIALSRFAPIGAACRIAFGTHSLREVAEHLSFCPLPIGCGSDDYKMLLRDRAGTMGAKQALLAMLARECGCAALQLVVACCGTFPSERLEKLPGVDEQASVALPLSVCWLKYHGRRLRLSGPRDEDPVIVHHFTESTIDPIKLPQARVALYRKFAADWCRVFNVSPRAFGGRRAVLLRESAGKTLFEDLLGYGIGPSYEPSLF